MSTLDDWTDPWDAPVIRWDPHGQKVCKCGHPDTAHQLDLKTTYCQTGGCGCREWRHEHDLVRGHVQKRVYVPEVPIDGPESST